MAITGADDLASDAATVRRGLDAWQDRSDGVSEAHASLIVREFESCLNDIVGEGVSQHLLKLVSKHHLLNEDTLRVLVSRAQALLDDVRRELLLGESDDLAFEAATEGSGEVRLVEVKDVLNNIVAEWVLNKIERALSDTGDELSSLSTLGMIDATLQDTATMAMSTNNDAVLGDSIVDELRSLSAESGQALLNDVVTVEVLNKVDNSVF